MKEKLLLVGLGMVLAAVTVFAYDFYYDESRSAYVFAESNIIAEGGIILNASIPQPTCNVAYRGLIWFKKGGTGQTDSFQVCLRTAAGTYTWFG